MNGLIKNAFIFVAGAGLGVLGSATYFYKRAQKACAEYEEKQAQDLEAFKKMYAYSTTLNATAEKNSTETDQEKGAGEKAARREPRTRVDYTAYSREPENLSDVINRAEKRLAEEESPSEEDARRPKLRGPKWIKNEEFGNDRTLDMVELLYYTKNGVLTDEEDNVIQEDAEAIMIGDILDKFDFKENDQQQYICVRNEKRGTDYKITKVDAYYYSG